MTAEQAGKRASGDELTVAFIVVEQEGSIDRVSAQVDDIESTIEQRPTQIIDGRTR